MTQYHKLVRDGIPEMIEAQGETPHVRILDQEEYIRCLEAKLDEEVAEYHRDKNTEELADILEVVYALAEAADTGRAELEKVYMRKHEARGGFEKRQFLVSKD